MRRLGLAALAICVAASGGAVACPTRADLSAGIQTTRQDPFLSSLWTQTDDGLTEVRMTERDGAVAETSSIYAHPLAVTRRIGSGGELELAYSVDPSALDTLEPGVPWESDLRLLSAGEELATGSLTLTRLEDTDHVVGDCTYTAWIARSDMRLDGFPPTVFDYVYSPDLGLVLASARLDEEGNIVSAVVFDEVEAR